MGSQTYSDATAQSNLTRSRLLVMIGGVAVVLFDTTMVWLYPDEPAMTGLRYLCAVAGLVFFTASYLSAHVRHHAAHYLFVVIALYTMIWSYNLYISAFSLPIILTHYNVIVGCSAVLTSRQNVGTYLGLAAAASTVALLYSTLSPAFMLIYLIGFYTLCALCYVTLSTTIGKQQELHQSQDVLATIVEESPDALWMGGTEGKPDVANALGMELHPLLLPLVQQVERQGLAEHRTSDLEWQLERELVTAGGYHFWGNLCVRRLPSERWNARSTYLVRVIDISERRRSEQALVSAKALAETALETRSRFLANMSHEIRTPMNGVIGMTSLLAETQLNTEQTEFVNVIKTSGEALLAIINDILDFSKIDAGELELEMQTFSVEQCVAEAAELLAALAHEKSIELVYAIDADVPDLCVGDMSRLRQVLLNLFSNAIKFTEQGEVTLKVSQQPAGNQPDHCQLHFAVTDTGIGIAPDKQANLFQPFTQADTSTTRVYGGTGLGLAICKQLVELMNGGIDVTSSPGAGATFHFHITVARVAEVYSHATSLAGKRALVVDDNHTNLKVISGILGRENMTLDLFDSPLEAIAQYRRQRYDVAVLDFNMPEMDGAELARQLRDIQPVPMILLSSNTLDNSEGLFDVRINKPVRPSLLTMNLKRLLSETANIQQQEAASSPNNHTHAPEATAMAALRVLVAEDNPVNQLVIRKVLQKLNIVPDLAANGQEAVDLCRTRDYDVVLMDVQMPVMDGLQATQAILRDNKSPPYIIALTANAMEGDRDECLQAGMHDYMSKPVDINLLHQRLKSIV